METRKLGCGGLAVSALEENASALEVRLTADDLRRINDAFSSGAASGPRYKEQMMAALNG